MPLRPLARIRNIGIIAHIDAGKTTATERFLYYAGSTHRIGEVHDGDTVMDFREDERERGITISAAATTFLWNDHQINLIDTPGHIDFTAEVERSLRVLDGAVVIFSGVEGVQSQSSTVWHQADRYGVPRLAFINKLDRAGANHERVLREIETRLGARPACINLPHGAENRLDGVIDLLSMQWIRFEPGTRGRESERLPIPAESLAAAQAARDFLVQRAAEAVDWLADLYLAEHAISEEQLRRAIREATLSRKLVPVLCGAALRDLGVQPVLDAVCAFLPSPAERPPARGHVPGSTIPTERPASPSEPFSALIFKVVAAPATDVFWFRVYSGVLGEDGRCLHPRTRHALRLRRLLRLYADRSEPVDKAECGDIVAVTGLRGVTTGDTICDAAHPVTFEPMHFPEPVVAAVVEAETSADRERLLDVIARLVREDPTFTYRLDEETGELRLLGMGELHLEILQNRMRRQFNLNARFGRPRVTYRETVRECAAGIGEFDRRVGDTRIIGRAVLEVAPRPRPAGDHDWEPVEIELDRLPASQQEEAKSLILGICTAGGAQGYAVIDTRIRLLEFTSNDPPDPLIPLRAAITLALRRAFASAGTQLLEPVMRLEVRAPEAFLGAVVRDLGSRRAEIRETDLAGPLPAIQAFVPLAVMLGYSTDLRSLTQGQGSFTMEPFDYLPQSGAGPAA